MTTVDTPAQPMSRRDVWLTVALAMAKDGLPGPRSVDIRDDILTVHIEFEHGRLGDAQRWAEHLGLERDDDVTTTDGTKVIVCWSSPGYRAQHGRTWRVGTTVPAEAPQSVALAEQVIAAVGAS